MPITRLETSKQEYFLHPNEQDCKVIPIKRDSDDFLRDSDPFRWDNPLVEISVSCLHQKGNLNNGILLTN
jgi:hypothetical protein